MSLPVLDLAPDLRFDDRVLRELPGDAETRPVPRQVPGKCWSRVMPTPVADPALLAWVPEVAALVGLPTDPAEAAALTPVFAGNALLPGMDPYAARYGGHQFGNWAGQLGDGRAITLGERLAPDGSRLELQLKGAGRTAYSRSADGRAVLRSSIRELVCSEAMHHLGVPTTRALCLVQTGDPVLRDMFYDGRAAYEPGAIVCRVAPSFLRLGSFQIHAAYREQEALDRLVAHALGAWFPELGPPGPASALAMLEEVCRRTAHTVAHWMRVGFVHGVMNTDNLSLLGHTIDYGPYGWLEPYDPSWTPNTTDLPGRRYAFGRQPAVAGWNLARFAEALYPIVGEIGPLEQALQTYTDTFSATWRDTIAAKLGLRSFRTADDPELVRELDEALQRAEIDMTLFYRHLAEVPAAIATDDALLAPLQPALYDAAAYVGEPRERMVAWLRRWRARVDEEGRDPAEREASMHAVNPLYVPRNYLAAQAIERAEGGDPSGVLELLDVLRRPYTAQPGREAYAARRPEWARDRPGCSTLSCSS